LRAPKIDFRPNCVQNFNLFLTQNTMPPDNKVQLVNFIDPDVFLISYKVFLFSI